jgi:hypothetical protein
MSRGCSQIRKKSHLTKENVQLILQAYFKDQQLKVEEVTDEDLSSGVNNQFNSEIIRLKIQFEDGRNPIRMIVKTPIQTGFQKMITKANKPFMRETFWYSEALPALKKTYPEIEDIAAISYHAYSAYSEDYT